MIPLPFILNLLLLERLSPGSIGRFDQSELCLFEAKRRLLSLLYQPIQVRCLLWYPYPPNRFAEDPFKPIFVKILPRNVHVQDSPRRQTVRIVRREEIGLTEIDVVYTFSRDHVKNEGCGRNCQKCQHPCQGFTYGSRPTPTGRGHTIFCRSRHFPGSSGQALCSLHHQ